MISSRKAPTQDRSQKMVERILNSTIALLKKQDSDKSFKLTTNHIAKEAGISVGSIYQYFPNIEAILFAIYEGVTAKIHAAMDEFNSEKYLKLPRDQFFDTLIRTGIQSEPDIEVGLELHNAMRIYPALAEAEKQHADLLAEKMAAFLQYYGSNWPRKRLKRLALYAFYIDYATWLYQEHSSAPAKETIEWEVSTFRSVLYKCFE